jgi:uncharacterized phage protein (TIGR02220 family)
MGKQNTIEKEAILQASFFKLLQEVSGQRNIITIPVILKRLTGGYESAALLSQILYWSGKMDDGFFYKSVAEWSEELCLSPMSVRTARAHLEELGLIDTKVERTDKAPTTFYRPRTEAILEKVTDLLESTKRGFVAGNKTDLLLVTNVPITGDYKTVRREEEDIVGKAKKTTNRRDIVVEVIDYLNLVTHRHYKPSESSAKLVNARVAEGFTLSDFCKVIDVKANEWDNTDMAKYLRPETLFAPSHFQSYLNQPMPKKLGVARIPTATGMTCTNIRQTVVESAKIAIEELGVR